MNILRSNTYKAPLPALPSDFFEYRESEDETAATLLSKHIWKLIKKSRHRLAQVPGCEGNSVSVMVAADFLSRLARDVVRVTEGELYGIRGCVLQIEYRDGDERVSIGRIKCDPKLPVTTHLTLSLTRDRTRTSSTSSLLRLFGWGSESIICISPGYLLEKRRLQTL
ncbi:RTP801-like [Trinorchestia longiramus]|nr:RTP801-like [Trinorchestia longiramus]